MRLRNFLYLNTKIVEDYISAIDGYTYDEESQEIASSSENSVNGGLGSKVVSAGGSHNGKQSEEIKRSVKISDAAKFDKIYKYLQSGDEDEQLKYYELLSEDVYNELRRDDFIEVLVTARFSKTKELTDSVQKIADLAMLIQGITDQQVLDKESTEAINGFSALGKMNSGKEISCVFNFDDGKYPLVAYLDENYFRCEQDSFVGQSYMLCKIIRKIPKGQSVKLDEIFDNIKKFPLNREQRRKMPQNMDNPEIIKDVVRGPAMVVVPVAVYQ
ncbi:MAG: hypothetical protein J1F02_07590 [Lachnospiraceae bacterium]|nr:hypothetical protein [Lachnospiraceae bacterium]